MHTSTHAGVFELKTIRCVDSSESTVCVSGCVNVYVSGSVCSCLCLV